MKGSMLALLALTTAASDDRFPETKTVYFPPSLATTASPCQFGKFGKAAKPIPILSEFENKWYSGQLSAAGEPSLFKTATPRSETSTIRFTWLRTFHPPVFVRIEGLDTRKPRVIAKQLTGAGGYAPGVIGKQIDRALTPAEAATIKTALQRTNVLHLVPVDCALGCDGAQWLVEGIDRTGYHFISRWSPSKGQVQEFGMAMLALTGWKFKDVY